jgi:LysM domain
VATPTNELAIICGFAYRSAMTRRLALSARLFLTPAVALLSSSSLWAQDSNTAQDAGDRVEAATGAAEERANEVSTDGEAGFGGEGRGGNAAVGGGSSTEAHQVLPGDTMWGISQRYLNNPYYWPKLWSYNQQFDNPNWIYPGSTVRLYPGNELPADPEPVATFDNLEGGGFETAPGAAFQQTSAFRRREFFVSADGLDDAGRILHSPHDKELLALHDRTWIDLKKQGQVGDTVQVYRHVRDVIHPLTGWKIGSMVELLGELRIDEVSNGQALSTIVTAWDAIMRGDSVGILPTYSDKPQPVANDKVVKGYIVDTGIIKSSFVGEEFLVVLDRGSADGVRVGNNFTIINVADGLSMDDRNHTDEKIGNIIVLETQKTTSTGLVVDSSRELAPGMRAEMRTKSP